MLFVIGILENQQRKSRFPLTTGGVTDISNYKVAILLKKYTQKKCPRLVADFGQRL